MDDLHAPEASFPEPRFVPTNGLRMAVRQLGEGPAVVLLHGFPELAWSWRHQLPALAAAGWRAIAPDLRGYGLTGPAGDVADYSMRNLARDVLGMMDALGIGRAVLVGHDFGGMLAWTLARDHAERFAGIVSLTTPYTRRGARDLAETMRARRGETNYMVQFQVPGAAEAALQADLARTFGGLMRRPAPDLARIWPAQTRLHSLPMSIFAGAEPILWGDPLLGPAELAVYVEAFRRTGFAGPLNWYRCLRQNWLDTAGTADRVLIPALMVSAELDIFLPPAAAAGMEAHVPDLERRLIAGCGHWTQQERPDVVNALLLSWLEKRMRPHFG